MAERPKLAIVEDNPDNRMLLEVLLGRDYELSVYDSGEAALAGIRTDPPALVVLDISLPRVDGTEVLRRLRADDQLRAIPVVALTAHAMPGDRDTFLTMGFDDYVSKPIVDVDILARAIRRLVGGVTELADKRAAVRRRYIERLADKARDLRALRHRLENADVLAELRKRAHNLRGSGASYGFEAITEAAGRVEVAAADELAEAVDRLIEIIEETAATHAV